MIRVLIADDQQLVRSGFRLILGCEEDIAVVAEAADGIEAVELTERMSPDVVVMDLRMPRLDGVQATERIVGDQATVAPRVLAVTTFDSDEHVFAALRAGASGFLLKDAPPEELTGAVRVVAAGDALLAPSVTRRVIEQFARQPVATQGLAHVEELTSREREVLGLIARGLSNVEIAESLVIGEATVKTHVGRILLKLGIRDRAQAVVVAYESGLVRPRGDARPRPAGPR
jgi:DNA-binding NarL/FixJ family response regulator